MTGNIFDSGETNAPWLMMGRMDAKLDIVLHRLESHEVRMNGLMERANQTAEKVATNQGAILELEKDQRDAAKRFDALETRLSKLEGLAAKALVLIAAFTTLMSVFGTYLFDKIFK